MKKFEKVLLKQIERKGFAEYKAESVLTVISETGNILVFVRDGHYDYMWGVCSIQNEHTLEKEIELFEESLLNTQYEMTDNAMIEAGMLAS